MKNVIGIGSVFDCFKRIILVSVQLKFLIVDEWWVWQEVEGCKCSEEFDRMNQKFCIEKIFE